MAGGDKCPKLNGEHVDYLCTKHKGHAGACNWLWYGDPDQEPIYRCFEKAPLNQNLQCTRERRHEGPHIFDAAPPDRCGDRAPAPGSHWCIRRKGHQGNHTDDRYSWIQHVARQPPVTFQVELCVSCWQRQPSDQQLKVDNLTCCWWCGCGGSHGYSIQIHCGEGYRSDGKMLTK